MAVRRSKVALAEVAELLGKDRKAARSYCRQVQALTGAAVPYSLIAAVMREVGCSDAHVVASRVRERGADN